MLEDVEGAVVVDKQRAGAGQAVVGRCVRGARRYEGNVAVGLERVAGVGRGVAAKNGGREDGVDGDVGGQVVWVERFPLAGVVVEQHAAREGKLAAVAGAVAIGRQVKRAVWADGKAGKAAANAVVAVGIGWDALGRR